MSSFDINKGRIAYQFLLNLFCVFSFVFLLLYLSVKTALYLDIFTSRDILRAVGWLEGKFYWPGPEMSAGNNLPGPFFYFLLFPALILGTDIYSSSVLWMIIWIALTYTTAFFFIGRISVNKESLLIFLVAFIANVGCAVFQPLEFAWNAGYSIMFHLLALMNIYYWKETSDSRYLYLSGIIIALGIQVHLLVLAHTMTVLLFYLFKSKNKQISSLLLFIGLVMAPLAVYMFIDYFQIFETSKGSYINYLNWTKKQITSEQWSNNIRQVFHVVYLMPLLFLIFLTLKSKLKTKKWPITQSTRDLFFMILIPTVIAVLGARMFWYTFFIPCFLMLFFSKWCDDLISVYSNRQKKINFLLFCVMLFVCSVVFLNHDICFSFLRNSKFAINNYTLLLFIFLILTILISINISLKSFWKYIILLLLMFLIVHEKITMELSTKKWCGISSNKIEKESVSKSFLPTWAKHQHLHPILKRIFLETNWAPKEAMKRIYAIGIHTEISLLSYYSLTKEALETEFKFDDQPRKQRSSEEVQGYIIIQNLKKLFNYSKEDWEKYLSQSGLLSTFLRQEIEKNRVLIDTPELYNQYWLIPYKVTKKSVFQSGFHNVGQPYYWEEPEWLKECNSTRKFKKGNNLYYCMVLSGYLQRAGIHVKISEPLSKITSSFNLDVTFLGPLLGTSDCSTSNNDYTLSLWSDIRMNVLCNEREYQYVLPNIGVDCELQDTNATERGKLFSAPLKLSIPIISSRTSCMKENIKMIEIGFNHYFRYLSDRTKANKEEIIWKTY